ncbi:MAG: hypothetical protein ABI843_02930 [Dokdonella sp.]
MRATIMVERYLASYGSYLIGTDAAAMLRSIRGVSAVNVDRQHLDRATLSFEAVDRHSLLARIDQLFESRGLHRV